MPPNPAISPPHPPRRRAVELAWFAVWLAVVVDAAWNHALWRDEVRALSKALAGRNVFALIANLRAEFHPALWYVLLRGAHALLPTPQVLQFMALAVASAAAWILVRCSPFRWQVKALLLAGNIFLFEYSVMCRNYGIAMLLLFLLALCYHRRRQRGLVLGILLFLLANTNVPAVFLTAGFLLLWLLDIAASPRLERPRLLKVFASNAAIALLGIALCALTVLPDSRLPELQGAASTSSTWQSVTLPGTGLRAIAKGMFLPGAEFWDLRPQFTPSTWYSGDRGSLLPHLLWSALLFGSALGLVRFPAALLAAWATLLALSLFFALFRTPLYRHEALWLCFLIACYWIAAGRSADPAAPASSRPIPDRVATLGWGLFVLLMALQVPLGVSNALAATGDGPPFSCSSTLGDLIRDTPALHDAILTSEPEDFLEAAPYYVSNRIFLVREQTFGNWVSFWKARTVFSLGDFLAAAQSVHAATRQPVLIAMRYRIDPSVPGRNYRDLRDWTFQTTSSQALAFLHATELLTSCPAALTDETYDIYLLK